MKDYKHDFIRFLLKMKALRFGEFTLKSGRLSPYFLNTGMLHSGESVAKLGSFYASAIVDNVKDNFSAIFGPAYKGIPLAVTTVNALFLNHGINVDYSFNRKEAKDHGDKGLIVGRELSGGNRVVVVDDVITAGTAVRETMEILKAQGNPEIAAIIISVDRMEKGAGDKSAIQEIAESTGIRFYPIVTILDIIEHLKTTPTSEHSVDCSLVAKMEEYRAKYGVE